MDIDTPAWMPDTSAHGISDLAESIDLSRLATADAEAPYVVALLRRLTRSVHCAFQSFTPDEGDGIDELTGHNAGRLFVGLPDTLSFGDMGLSTQTGAGIELT